MFEHSSKANVMKEWSTELMAKKEIDTCRYYVRRLKKVEGKYGHHHFICSKKLT